MKSLKWPGIFFLSFLLLHCASGGTRHLAIRYQTTNPFPTLQQKIGTSLAVAPFKDQRHDTLYLGLHEPLAGSYTYFKSDPSPLEKTVRDSLLRVLPPYGVKVVSVPSWDGSPESLTSLETDSVLFIEIKKFWIEGHASLTGTKVQSSARIAFHLGVKKEGKVFTRNVELEREMTLTRFTTENAEEMMNQVLSDIFDSYLSNPY